MSIAYNEFAWQAWTFDAEEVVAGHYFLGIPIGFKVRYATYLLGSVELKIMRRENLAYDHLQILESRTGKRSYPLVPLMGSDFKGRDGKPLGTIHGPHLPREAPLADEGVECLLEGDAEQVGDHPHPARQPRRTRSGIATTTFSTALGQVHGPESGSQDGSACGRTGFGIGESTERSAREPLAMFPHCTELQSGRETGACLVEVIQHRCPAHPGACESDESRSPPPYPPRG